MPAMEKKEKNYFFCFILLIKLNIVIYLINRDFIISIMIKKIKEFFIFKI